MNPVREGNLLMRSARGAAVVHPVLGRAAGSDAVQGVAGNMDQIRQMVQQLLAEEKAKLLAEENAPLDPVTEARKVLAEELSKARQQEQSRQRPVVPETFGTEMLQLGGFPVDGVAGTSRGRTREASGTSPALAMQTGRDFGVTATVGNSRFTVALPPKYNPSAISWLLWKPQVDSYMEMVGLDGILDPVKGPLFGLQVNRYVIGTLKQICPDLDGAWMSTLHLKFAHQAWEQLRKAYGSRAELDMQKKLFEFESAAQADNETVREWTIRLERQVTELNVMSKEAAKENVMGYNEHRDTAVYESTHKFRLLNVRIDNPSHEAFVATLRCQIYGMDLKDVESSLITYEQGREVQRALSAAAGGTNTRLYQLNTAGALRCYVCGGEHSWKVCKDTPTPEGYSKLKARGIYVPRELLPPRVSVPPSRFDPNQGRGYGGRQYFAGRGRFGRVPGGRGPAGGRAPRGRGPNVNHVHFDVDERVRDGATLA
jgi:hypothetical protein